MWGKLLYSSFQRDFRKKLVALSAVILATCLATFLLNWSLNLGDKIQQDLRAYGANIWIHPLGESLDLQTGRYLHTEELQGLKKIFWRNQILAYAPLLPQKVQYDSHSVLLVGTTFGEEDPVNDLRKISPYLAIRGRWPARENEAVAGALVAGKFSWNPGDRISVSYQGRQQTFLITGIVESGGQEDEQLFAPLTEVQNLTEHEGEFKHLLVSALVTPVNDLYRKYQKNPGALSPVEMERYSCTPYISVVAKEIADVFQGAQARVIRRISQSEEKIANKVNWLMVLVTLAALIASSLTTTSTATAIVLERKKELALMKAIGSHNGFLVAYLFTEILLLGILGSVIGFALGSVLSVGLSPIIFQTPLDWKPIVLPVVTAAGALIILLGSIFPLKQAIAVEPSIVLKDL